MHFPDEVIDVFICGITFAACFVELANVLQEPDTAEPVDESSLVPFKQSKQRSDDQPLPKQELFQV